LKRAGNQISYSDRVGSDSPDRAVNDAAPLSETVDDRIVVRGHDLADELIGRVSFTEMFLLDLHGTPQSAAHVRVVDAILVSLMEHGITPSTLAARLVADGAPEAAQAAVAAGLLAAGSRFLGVIEETAALVQAIVADPPVEEAARRVIRETLARGGRVPGFGHNLHAGVDPRVGALRRIAEAEGVGGPHLAAVGTLAATIASESRRSLIPNAAIVVGAILSDLGYGVRDVRSFALVARCAGIVAHLADERRSPIARSIWEGAHGGSD
jgi:citrate synthase